MQIYGQSEFSVVANPVVSSNPSTVLYDTFASFTEGATNYNYSLVNGIAYVSTVTAGKDPLVKCLDSDAQPPINAIVDALMDAAPISSASTSGLIECTNGETFKVSLNNVDFAVCYWGSSGFTLHGSEMDIAVEYMKTRADISAPSGVDKQGCVAAVSPSPTTSVGKSMLIGKPVVSSAVRSLEEVSADFLDILKPDLPSCTCKSEPRPCLFVHGLGIGKEEPENLDAFPQYWGNLTDHAPCCTSMKYTVLNTLNYSWTDDQQQEKLCDRALSVSDTSEGTTIADTIIISHSMGGLIIAGALANGKCKFAASTTWVAISSPMRGSMAAGYFQESCKGNTNLVYEKFVNTTGFCPADEGIKSLAYQGEKYSNPKLDAAYKAAQKAYQKHVYALMCSNAFTGLTSDTQAPYWILGLTIPHKSKKNDGMVEFFSCAGGFPASKFGDNWRDRFYVTKLTHDDTTFRNGDALLNEAKMPVKWFECLL
ncbi:hypothetical protein PHYBOEH_009039 [Phytophthora boehmeriae]|uniref:Uncharacterized protein n=1 Tax=Phytophthora boehmeriae TaxID=109152 RepID=A0A8T1X2A9_9STRA|nr:hypothetical protein PHYBOEH_009039 [Phytophthora boehmeriae]